MAIAITGQAELSRLRRDIARIEGRFAEAEPLVLGGALPSGDQAKREGQGLETTPASKPGRLSLGLEPLDRILRGGLPLAALHDIRALRKP